MIEDIMVYQLAVKHMGASLIENLSDKPTVDSGLCKQYLDVMTEIRKNRPWLHEEKGKDEILKAYLQKVADVWPLHLAITSHWCCSFDTDTGKYTGLLAGCISNSLAMHRNSDPESFCTMYQYERWLLSLVVIVDNLNHFKALIKQSENLSPVTLTN